MSTSVRLARLIALAALLSSPTSTLAFTGDNHKELTAAAFRVLADPQTVAELRAASVIGDSKAYEPLAPGIPWYLSAAHFDNCAWSEGSTWIKDHRKAAVSAAIAYDANPTAALRAEVFGNFGFVLHATEDFYAHSHWVESHSWGTLANLDGAEPAGWFSGTYPDDLPKKCPAGVPHHDVLNKDSASRAGFDEAYADAILAIQDQLDRFVAELRAAAPARADAILARLGLRRQAQVISEALAWPTGKVYFFQGGAYSRYDLVTDHVDPGYPRDTATSWTGLGDLGGVIDAALIAPGGADAYFFRGMRYCRYDVAADRVDDGYPLDIGTYWHGLWGSGLDAAVLWPDGRIYFFRGPLYERYDFEDDQVDNGYPLPIVGPWRGLEPFSDGIDAVFVTPNGQKAYFFRGDYYIRYDVALDRADPGYPLRIEDYWHGL
ncbi:hemopexin repeat-containing protein [Pyxidicoccus sp. MSG2]|uniref:hemopexin repeat-containing protein n=1 Tax=Pyxidicoccus sp. MSG2 TaxID=2996790 RepID=UPI0022722A8B|nr:hemopexin repeat-containing protein [Pyxidicoccus sp. MSG2]MCY1022531.1 hemopexin repeat-containing protein [Pyxidicoccus sp. MSG2]